jgi:hypothetical protein
MTKVTTAPKEQVVLFCPGCDKRKPSGIEEARGKIGDDYEPCCNPECQGEWGTGCWHCHYPKFWPKPVYRVEAVLQKKVERTITSFIRASSPAKAVPIFTEKLRGILLVEAGLKWRIRLFNEKELWIQDYDHYAKGATIYHILVSAETGEPLMDEKETEKHAAQQAVAASSKITRAEALESLRVYLSQQVEYEAINIVEAIINELVAHPGEHQQYRRVKVEVGHIPFDGQYNEMLQQASALQLGKLTPPAWLERFKELIAEIRKEHDLNEETRERAEPDHNPLWGTQHER